MATIADSTTAIDRVLAEIDAPVLRQYRMQVGPADAVAIPRAAVKLVYVIAGSVTEHPIAGSAAERPAAEVSTLSTGDARLYTGRGAYSLLADDAFVLVSEFDFTRSGTSALDLLPSTVTVLGLPGSDPAVAALAAELRPRRVAVAHERPLSRSRGRGHPRRPGPRLDRR
jgi:hypothetical protein